MPNPPPCFQLRPSKSFYCQYIDGWMSKSQTDRPQKINLLQNQNSLLCTSTEQAIGGRHKRDMGDQANSILPPRRLGCSSSPTCAA